MKFKSLRVRLALWALLLLGMAYIVVSFLFYRSSVIWLEGQVDRTLLVTASQMSAVLTEDGETPKRGDLNLESNRRNQVIQTFLREQMFFVRLIDGETGEIIDSSASYDLPVTEQPQTSTGHYETFRLPGDGAEMRLYTIPLPVRRPMLLQTGISLREVRETQAQIWRLLVVGFVVIAVLSLGSGWFLANRALIPIRAITDTAAEINERELTRRLDLTTSEVELTQLVHTFNTMLERIEQAFNRQRQFTADAAHELRTPLSIMQTGLDVTLSQERDATRYRATLTSIHEEVQRLSQLANALLLLARGDARELPLVEQPVNLSLLLDTVIAQFEGLAEEKKISIEHEIAPGLHVQGDEDRLIQIMLNLIDNAIKYSPEGGTVRIIARNHYPQVEVVISDSGPGIAEADQAHIFDRFHRVDGARNRSQGGFGLGLAIVKQIVDLHRGSIRVISQPGQGAQFVVTLPEIRDMQV